MPVLRALPAARQHGHNSHTQRPLSPDSCSLTSNPLTGLVEEGFAIMFDGIRRGTDVEYAVAVLGRKYGRVSPGSRPSLRRWSFEQGMFALTPPCLRARAQTCRSTVYSPSCTGGSRMFGAQTR